jgi:hypothetical protein
MVKITVEEMRRAIEAEREAIDAGRPASRTIAEFDVEELERMAAETAEAEARPFAAQPAGCNS